MSEHPDREICGQPNVAQHQCDQRTCPRCWRRWSSQATYRAVSRMVAFDWENGGEDMVHLDSNRWIHATISDRRFHDMEPSEARSLGTALAKEAGVTGGTVIYHAYRIKDDVKQLLRKENLTPFWEAVHNDELDLGSWIAYVKWSPHVHVIGTAGRRWSGDEQLREGQEVGTSDTVFKRIGDLDSVEDLVGATYYTLSHVSMPKGSHSNTWFGDLAYNVFSGATDRVQGEIDRRLATVSSSLRKVVENQLNDGEKTCDRCGEKGNFNPIWEAKDLLRDPTLEIRAGPALRRAYTWVTTPDRTRGLVDSPDPTCEQSARAWIFDGPDAGTKITDGL